MVATFVISSLFTLLLHPVVRRFKNISLPLLRFFLKHHLQFIGFAAASFHEVGCFVGFQPDGGTTSSSSTLTLESAEASCTSQGFPMVWIFSSSIFGELYIYCLDRRDRRA